MAEKKYSAFALLDVLIRYSDEEHILTTKQLQELILQNYHLELERRTIYSNIDILEQSGYEISRYEENGKGYYLKKRQFDASEILLLCNAIHSSHFISSKQSDQLIKKLLDTLSKYQVKEFKDSVYLPNDQKTANAELLRTIRVVSKAIRDHKVLTFTYLKYDENKHLVPRRELPYVVEPHYIVYADARPYMIVTSQNHDGFIHYRLDRMKDAKIIDKKFTPLRNHEDAYQYAKNKVFMFAGTMESVTLECQEHILDHMIDIFGTEAFISPGKPGYFILRVKAIPQGILVLAQQYMDSLTILEPKELRDTFKDLLKDAMKKYK